MSTRQETSITSGLTRRTALTHVAAGGIAAIALSTTRVAAQETEPLPPLELARRAGEMRSALVPVVVKIHAQSDQELDQSATESLDQLKEQQNVTEEEASSLQQILDEVSSEDDDQTKIEKIQAIADKFGEEGVDASPAALAIAVIALAIARRDERSASGETATPSAEEEGADFWDRVKRGIVGAIAGAAVGGLVAGEDGAVVGAIAGGLIAAI
jgi:hypothetical protein